MLVLIFKILVLYTELNKNMNENVYFPNIMSFTKF